MRFRTQARGLLLGLPLAASLAVGVTALAAARSDRPLLTPVADAYVRPDAPQRNFGTATSFETGAGSTAYLRFSVTLPPDAVVSRVTLRLFATSASPGGLTVDRVSNTTWGEHAIDDANAPAVGARVGSSPGWRRRGYVAIDVTPLVAGSGTVSLALRSTSRAGLWFRSREASAGRPILVVEPGAAATAGPCGSAAAPPPRVDHVIWIWMENKPYDAVVGSPAAPYTNQLASGCGLATSYHGVAHPSLPNYIAATSGGTQGITDDDPPSSHPLDVPSIYSQVRAAGGTWRDYAESAPGNCPLASSGSYAVKHDPAAYYTGIRTDCASWDVPLGTTSSGAFLGDLTAGTLPAFAFVTPDLCDDTHDCPVAAGDAWLASWLPRIVSSPAYLAGTTVVFITWDEDDGSSSNHVPLIVVSPSTTPGTQSATAFDHYSLLRTTEQLLGLPYLGQAASAPSMASAFNVG